VTLQGWKGPVAQATADEFGEFQFDFNLVSNLSLEMRIAETNYITIPLPVSVRGPVEVRPDLRNCSSRQHRSMSIKN